MDGVADPALALAVPFIARWEAFRATPYRDQGGKYTIGYGQTYTADNRPVTAHTPPITEAEAMDYLQGLVATIYLPGVLGALRRPATAHQTAAMVSLAYNIGVRAFAGSELVRAFNAGAVESAADQFLVWNKVRDPQSHILTVSRGLSRRRIEERAMFLAADSVSPVRDNATCVSPAADSETQIIDALNARELARVKGH